MSDRSFFYFEVTKTFQRISHLMVLGAIVVCLLIASCLLAVSAEVIPAPGDPVTASIAFVAAVVFVGLSYVLYWFAPYMRWIAVAFWAVIASYATMRALFDTHHVWSGRADDLFLLASICVAIAILLTRFALWHQHQQPIDRS